MILTADEIKQSNVEGEVLRVFLKAIDLVGGPYQLVQKRNLTWLPSLLQAAYIVVLSEHGKLASEIASFLGITEQTVRNTLRSDVEKLKRKLENEGLTGESEKAKTHIAGALAKWAYAEIKAGREHIPFLAEIYEEFGKALGIEWPLEVLIRIRGLRFPIDKTLLSERLADLKVIKGKPIEDVLNRLPDKLSTPAELLKRIKEALEES